MSAVYMGKRFSPYGGRGGRLSLSDIILPGMKAEGR